MDISGFILPEPEANEAVLLLTNRLLMDGLSLLVDTGTLPRENVEHLIRFSANEVIKGSPHLATAVNFFAEMSINRLPAPKAD